MANTVFASGRRLSVTSVPYNSTQYYALGGLPVTDGTENNIESVLRTGGTLYDLVIHVSTNTVNNTRTFRSRVNGASGNLSVTIATSTTGFYRDNSNSDTITAGDTVNYQLPSSGATGGNTGISSITTRYNASSGGSYQNIGGSVTISSSGTVYMLAPANAGNITENNLRYKFLNSVTAKNLRFYVSSNTKTTDVVITVRKNGVDTALTTTITASTTGQFTDTSNTVDFASGDYLSIGRVAGAGTGSCSISHSDLELASSSGISYLITASSAGTSFSTTTARYFQFNCSIEDNNNEPTEEFTLDGTLSHLQAVVSANSTTGSSTLKFRVNAANSSATLSIASGTTGHFENTSDSKSVTSGDDVGFAWANGSAHSLTLNLVGARFSESASGRKRSFGAIFG